MKKSTKLKNWKDVVFCSMIMLAGIIFWRWFSATNKFVAELIGGMVVLAAITVCVLSIIENLQEEEKKEEEK